jgi:peptidylprolyl isomerase
MKVVKEGDRVSISCEIKLENGDLCFKNEEENYIEIVVGEGKFFPQIENELKEMEEGDTKTINLEPKDAFGPYINDLVMEVPKDVFRSDVELDVGSKVKINAPSGKTYYGTVTNQSEENLTLDLNHPLAGKKIMITVTVASIGENQQSSTEKKLRFPRFQLKIPKKKLKAKPRKSTVNPLKTK